MQPYQPNPLPAGFQFGYIELVREAATLVMLAAVGWLAGRRNSAKFGYALLAFGIWDMGYYVFLHLMNGWPGSLTDWDILFLLPLPWWGPVWAPMAISLLMIGLGTLLSQFSIPAGAPGPQRAAWWLAGTGAIVTLYTFMAEAIVILPASETALRALLPSSFQWPRFLIGLGMMSAPLWVMANRVGSTLLTRKGRIG